MMDLFVLDENLNEFAIVDTYKSMIWTDRYNECGDFEFYTQMSSDILDVIKQDYYLVRRDSEHVMIIEKLLISSNAEEGDTLTVTGRSLESILDRRVVWGQKTLSGNLQEGIKTLINENIISPSNENRKIPNFIFEDSTDSSITAMTIEAQYTGDNLYDVITKICSERNLGFKITLNENKQFVFKLYTGIDRSYNQIENPYVIFSPNFDNLISNNYMESKSALKNVTLVGGEGEGSSRRYTAVGNVSGLNRREMFTDARDISSDNGDEGTLSNDEYIALLRQRGKEDLSENIEIVSFEGQAETTLMFKYGEDFFMGDVVQISNEYGKEATARILELVTSESEEGFSIYPTFSMIDSKTLPSNYLKLEYIESSGTQYINTKFTPDSNTEIVADIQLVNSQGTISLFGARSALSQTDPNAFVVFVLNGTTFRSDWFGSSVSGTPSDLLQRTMIDRNRNDCEAWDIVLTNTSTVNSCKLPMFLFAVNNAGSANYYASARLYSCKIYNNDVLVRDFVPCKNEKDIVGLYDLIEEVFYANSGTGAFIAG